MPLPVDGVTETFAGGCAVPTRMGTTAAPASGAASEAASESCAVTRRVCALGARGAEDGLGGAKAVRQLSRSSGAQTRDEFQCQPVKLFFPAEYRRWHDAGLVDHDDTSRRRGYASGFVGGGCKWFHFVWVGRENGFVWYFLVFGATVGRRLNGRECHAGSIVERGKGVVGGRAFVFNGK